MVELNVASTVILLLSVTTFHYVSAQDGNGVCGQIGRVDEIALASRREQMFYLNTANPAPCNGTITSWRVCYYGPNIVEFSSYWATYALYRPRTDSSGNQIYRRVSEMFSAVQATGLLAATNSEGIIDGAIQAGGFQCFNDSMADTPLTVQAGDILGACVFDPVNANTFSRQQLDIVGESIPGASSLLGMNSNLCDLDALPTSIESNQLSTILSRRLHLYANIATIETITSLPPTSLSTTIVEGTTTDVELTTGSPLSTTIHTDIPGQVAGVVIIAVASSGGGLFLIILLLFVIILVFVSLKKYKTKKYNYPTNVSYNKRTAEDLSTQIDDYEVVTDSNVAYEDTKLDVTMEENTAYEPTVIPVSHNAAYAGVGRSQDETEEQDYYDYI